jgi:tripartite-type tricarboxylate transporter receptor subunit TctC
VPAKTPQGIIDKMNADIKTVLADPVIREKLGKLGTETVGSSAEELGALLRSEDAKWGPIIKELGISEG